jgi:hypothetical protein
MLPGFAHYSTGKSRIFPILGAKEDFGWSVKESRISLLQNPIVSPFD